MNHVIYFFGSGAAFLCGVGCLLAVVVLQSLRRGKWSLRAGTFLALVGMILVTVSATPLPYWLYAVASVLTVAWIVAERSEPVAAARLRRLVASRCYGDASGGAGARDTISLRAGAGAYG